LHHLGGGTANFKINPAIVRDAENQCQPQFLA